MHETNLNARNGQIEPNRLSAAAMVGGTKIETTVPAAASKNEKTVNGVPRWCSFATYISSSLGQGSSGVSVSASAMKVCSCHQVRRLSTSAREKRNWPPGSRLGFKWCCFTYLWRVGRLMQRCLHTCSLVSHSTVDFS